MEITTTSCHIYGSTPCSQLRLTMWRSLHTATQQRWISISLVIPSGPGDFLGFSFFRALCSPPSMKGCCTGFTVVILDVLSLVSLLASLYLTYIRLEYIALICKVVSKLVSSLLPIQQLAVCFQGDLCSV